MMYACSDVCANANAPVKPYGSVFDASGRYSAHCDGNGFLRYNTQLCNGMYSQSGIQFSIANCTGVPQFEVVL